MKKSIQKMLLITSIALFSIIVTSCSTLPNKYNNNQNIRTINVSGSSSINAVPDIASFSVEISEIRDTSSKALQAMNKKITSVLEICDKYQIEEKDRKTNSINLRTDYDWIDNKQVVNGQIASQSINIKLRNINNLGPIIDSLSNINEISIGSIYFNKENTDTENSKARMLAVQDAHKKAQEIADAAGMILSNPISINNTSSPVSYNYPTMLKSSSMEAAYDNYTTQAPTGEIKITGEVVVMYEMISK